MFTNAEHSTTNLKRVFSLIVKMVNCYFLFTVHLNNSLVYAIKRAKVFWIFLQT